MRPVRIALYGDVNLNLVDGSAIWLASLAHVLHRIERTRLTVLCKAPVRRDLVTAELAALPRLQLVEHPTGRALTPAQALDELERLDREAPFDLVVLRGYALARQGARRPRLAGRFWTYLTDIEQDPAARTDGDRMEVAAIATVSDHLLCQTEQLRGHLEGIARAAANRTILLPPMVAPTFVDAAARRPAHPARGRRLVYAGKFAPGWGVLEMVAAFARLRDVHPALELHVAGDKIHDPPDDPGFRPAVEAVLRSTDRLAWHGVVTRARVAALLADADIALSPRDHRLDDSLELSTKLLEYGAAGVPVVCNRTAMHAELLGQDYPLFIDDLDELDTVLDEAIRDERRWRHAAEVAHGVAIGYTYDRVADLLRPHLARRVPDVTWATRRPPRVLVASHDRKFFTAISDHLARCGAQVAFDDWQGHARHDEAASKDLLEGADVVICEWAVGNAVWYSHNLRPGQRLVVRLHRMELETPFPAEIRFDAVERAVVVSEPFRDKVVAQLGWSTERIAVVPNWVDTLLLDRPKLPDARFHLGLLGWVPQRKRLDRALDVIERLTRDDDRWRLHLGGAPPWGLRWVWMRLAEREHFTDQLDRIRLSPVLRRAVNVDGHQHNVASWLRQVGFVLSPSDDESFHLAPAEGMASGAVPVIWPWETAAGVYGERWLCDDVPTAVERIASTDWEAERRAAQAYVRRRYPLGPVVDAWADLVLGARAGP